jgi:AICAR transformylase/IMP cyclohydrolase PurH
VCRTPSWKFSGEVIVARSSPLKRWRSCRKKKNLRFAQGAQAHPAIHAQRHSRCGRGFLPRCRIRDLKVTLAADLKVVTKRPAYRQEMQAMLFGWRVVKHCKSTLPLFTRARIARLESVLAR